MWFRVRFLVAAPAAALRRAAPRHRLVYPERSSRHGGFQAFRGWIPDEAAQFRAKPKLGMRRAGPTPRGKSGKRARVRSRATRNG